MWLSVSLNVWTDISVFDPLKLDLFGHEKKTMSDTVYKCLEHINNISNSNLIRNADGLVSRRKVDVPVDWVGGNKVRSTPAKFKVSYWFLFRFIAWFTEQGHSLYCKKIEVDWLFYISITSKMFYLVCRAYEEFVWKMRLPKHIFGESDYQEFLLTELLQLSIEILDEFSPLIKKTALCFHLLMRSWRSFFRAFVIQNSLSWYFIVGVKAKLSKDVNTVQDFWSVPKTREESLMMFFLSAILI